MTNLTFYFAFSVAKATLESLASVWAGCTYSTHVCMYVWIPFYIFKPSLKGTLFAEIFFSQTLLRVHTSHTEKDEQKVKL